LPESFILNKKIVDAFDELNETVRSKLNDKELHPELDWDANVRLSNDICDDEKNFIKDRKNYIREKFAKYVGVDVEEIDIEDIPIIGFAGSGGGFRAMIATTGYLSALQDSGLYDCGMYLSGK
jgi:phospholipase A2